ncbi:hypothetical protein Tco_0005817 [Tanacetum coccineum]
MQYESRVNERQNQTTEEKTDTSNVLDALDASSVIIESNGTKSKEQDTSSRSGNDAHVDAADIRPIYNVEPMDVGTNTAKINFFATGQTASVQPEIINEGEVDQNMVPTGKDIRLSTTKVDSEPQMYIVQSYWEGLSVWLRKKKESQKTGLKGILIYDHEKTFDTARIKTVGLHIKPRSSRQKTFDHSRSSLGLHVKRPVQASVFMSMMSDHNSSDLAPQRQEMSVENVSSGLVPQGQKASDYDNSDPVPPRQNVVPTAEKTVSFTNTGRIYLQSFT